MVTDRSRAQDRLRWFVARCAQAGITATHQRREIYAVLSATVEHPDAETVYRRVRRRIPAISLDTVYRNLRTMESHGIIQRAAAIGYRARFDANVRPHHHFVCTTCGRIRDFSDSRMDGYRPSPDVVAMGTIRSMHVELRGVCGACAAIPESEHRGHAEMAFHAGIAHPSPLTQKPKEE